MNSCGNLPFPKGSASEPLKIQRFYTKGHVFSRDAPSKKKQDFQSATDGLEKK